MGILDPVVLRATGLLETGGADLLQRGPIRAQAASDDGAGLAGASD